MVSAIVTSQESVQNAQLLIDRILKHARAHNIKALLTIEAEPETEVLLGLLPESESRQARAHLMGARVWRAQQNEKAKVKLDAAKSALDELDISLARGILRRIDPTILDESGLVRYDELLLAVEARAVELEDIQSRLPASPTAQKQKPRKRFWKR